MTDIVPIHNLSSVGVVKDRRPHTLQPEAWTDAKNVKLVADGLELFKGHVAAIASPLGSPQFIFSVPALNETAWIYCSATRAYAYMSGVSSEITRMSAGSPDPYLTLAPHDWEGVLLGGIPILNNQVDPPQWWSAVDGGTKLANLTNWPANTSAKSLVAFGPYLVAMNVTESGTKYPHMVWWSHKVDPGTIPASWDYTDPTVDAGRLELTDVVGGEIVDGLLLGNVLIIYKQYSTHMLQFVGGQDLFSPALLLASSGILTSKCACSFNKGGQHFVVAADDIIIHSGSKNADSVVDGTMRKAIFADMDSLNYVNSFVFDNPSYKEVWFAYPEAGATYPTKAAVWGYGNANRGWTFREFKGCCADRGRFYNASAGDWNSDAGQWDTDSELWSTPGTDRVLFGDNSANKVYMLDEGTTFDGLVPNAYIERTGLAIYGKDRQGQPKVDYRVRKLVTRVWPKLTGGQCLVTVGGQEDEAHSVVWGSAVLFDSATAEFVDFDPPVNTRLLAIRFELLTSDTQLSGYDIEVAKISNL